MTKLWIVYDSRAIPKEHLSEKAKRIFKKLGNHRASHFFPGDTDEASVLVSCHSLKEARSYSKEFGSDNCVYEYDIVNNELVNEKFVEVL